MTHTTAYHRLQLHETFNPLYLQLPRFLFEGELRDGLSNDARILYAALKARHSLSDRNAWVNENQEVYFLFSREEMCRMIGCSLPTLRKALRLLRQFRLIEEERQGLGRPNRIYLTRYEDPGAGETPLPSRKKESFRLGKKIFSPNQKEKKQENPEILSSSDGDDTQTPLSQGLPWDAVQSADCPASFLSAVLTVLQNACRPDRRPAIGKERPPADTVRRQLRRLRKEHIEHVYQCVSSTAREIRNFPAYLLACLYHAPESYALAQAVPPYSPPCEDRRPTYDLEAYEAMDFLAELRR